jgi:uncharacterized protein YndB with AHSA1/START domain
MKEIGFVAKRSITINAPPAKVWNALTNPDMIKQYLFGTQVTSDWKVGSSIRYKGTWEGKSYEDKGVILQLIPEHMFQSTYWSSMSGTEDKPENYATVIYEIESRPDSVLLTITQDNNSTDEARKHSENNWGMVLETIKKMLEK